MLKSKFKALVVDDDAIARRTVGFALLNENFDCAYACDGIDALQRLEVESFDLVVTDLRMPNKHGHALAVELLARKSTAMLVIHTSVDDPRMAKDLMLRGVDDIVYKPTNYPAFAAKMRAKVERRKAAPGNTSEPELECPVPLIGWADYERRLTNVQSLFPLSSAAYEVYFLSSRDDIDLRQLVGAMLNDAALMADVLRLANSPFFVRTNRPTTELEEAIVRIGFKRVGEVALALNAQAAVRDCVLPWLDTKLCQARSIATSIALERLCQVREFRTSNGMMICGFLHPLGRLVLGSAFPDEYQSLIHACLERHAALIDLETRAFPEKHTAALGRVLSRWNVPGDIWTPLTYLSESYEVISQLEGSLRDRVELIKLAVFIGNIAVGGWMPWDQIEPPPAKLLARHRLPQLATLIEYTKAVLGGIESHKVANDSTNADRSTPAQVGKRCVRYCDLTGSNATWMRPLIASLEIEVVAEDGGNAHSADAMLVNCLDGHPNDILVAGRRKEWQRQRPHFLIARNDPSEMDDCGTTTRFPVSVAALQASCERLAAAGSLSQTRKASALAGEQPAQPKLPA